MSTGKLTWNKATSNSRAEWDSLPIGTTVILHWNDPSSKSIHTIEVCWVKESENNILAYGLSMEDYCGVYPRSEVDWENITIVDYSVESTTENQMCTCDFYSVVLVTGCRCGGK